MKLLRHLLRRKFFVGMAVGVSMSIVVTSFQNCSPANFTKMSSNTSVKTDGVDGGGDINPPNRNCDGFWVNRISEVTIPSGQNSVQINLNGWPGNAGMPMTWKMSKTGWSWGPQVGTQASVNLTPGVYTVQATAGLDNLCTDQFQLKIQSADQCIIPFASNIGLELVSNPNELYVNEPVQFKINNFAELTAVQVQWQANGAWENVVSSPFNHTYADPTPGPGTYIVTAKAKDKVNPACEFTISRTVTIKKRTPVCIPTTARMDITPPSSNAGSDRTLEFRINNLTQLVGNKVTVDCGTGIGVTGSGDYTQNPIRCTYPEVQADTNRRVTIRAKSKGTDPSCETPLEYTFDYLQKKPVCVPTISQTDFRSRITATPSTGVTTTTPVKFNTTLNAAAFTQFTWNLANGVSGNSVSGLQASNPVTYSQPGQYRATFAGYGPGTCNEPYNHEIVIDVVRQEYSQEFRVSQDSRKPPVKMFFIIDNSVTMTDEQIRLSQAFSNMFSDANINNLKQFNTTLHVFNTAQYSSTKGTNSSIDNLLHRPTPLSVGSVTPYNFLYGLAQPDEPYMYPYLNARKACSASSTSCGTRVGTIAGDVVGYRNINSYNSQYFNFEIAPVANFLQGENPSVSSQTKLFSTLNANAPTTEVNNFVQDFKDRVKYLNPTYYSSNQYDVLTQKESGLCAVARILESGQYIGPEDQASFVIVSDEDEDYLNGNNCIKSTGSQTVETGACYPSGTSFRWTTQAYCEYRYPTYSTTTYDFSLRALRTRESQCVRYDDRNNCIDWNYTYTTTPCGAGAPCTCPTTGETCAVVEIGGSDVVTTTTQPLPPPSSGPCPASIVQGLAAQYGEAFVANSCYASTNYSGYASDYVHNGVNSQTDCMSVRPTSCNPASGCSGQLHFEYADVTIPVADLECGSQCPNGHHMSCGTGSIAEYIMSQGGTCSGGMPVLLTSPAYEVGRRTVPSTMSSSERCAEYPNYFWRTDQYGTQTQQLTTFVTGTNNGRPAKTLSQYITDKVNEMAGRGLKPTFTSFTYMTTPNNDPGASLGTNYMNLVQSTGFPSMKFAINQNDYGYPLQVLTNYIQQLVRAVFDFNLSSGQAIRKITWKRGAAAAVEIQSNSYVHTGTTLRVGIQENDKLKVNLTNGTSIYLEAGDVIRVEYW